MVGYAARTIVSSRCLQRVWCEEGGLPQFDDTWTRTRDAEHRTAGYGGNRNPSGRRRANLSGIKKLARADLARFDRSRKNRKTSNKEWRSLQDSYAKIAKMKVGRTHLVHNGRVRGRPLDGSHPLGDRVRCLGRRFGDDSGDPDDRGGVGRGSAARRSGGRRDGL